MHTIEYIYSAHSAFAYIGSKHLLELCARHSVELIHKPILLSPVVEAQNRQPFRTRTQAHLDYFFGREVDRWAEYRSVPIIGFRPTYHDADYSVASGLVLALGEHGAAVDEMAHGLMQAHWQHDADLSNEETLTRIATDLGHDGPELLKQAKSATVQKQLRDNSDWAVSQHVFGSPTYIVNGDPFYGQDRLELVERALNKPFAPSAN